MINDSKVTGFVSRPYTEVEKALVEQAIKDGKVTKIKHKEDSSYSGRKMFIKGY